MRAFLAALCQLLFPASLSSRKASPSEPHAATSRSLGGEGIAADAIPAASVSCRVFLFGSRFPTLRLLRSPVLESFRLGREGCKSAGAAGSGSKSLRSSGGGCGNCKGGCSAAESLKISLKFLILRNWCCVTSEGDRSPGGWPLKGLPVSWCLFA